MVGMAVDNVLILNEYAKNWQRVRHRNKDYPVTTSAVVDCDANITTLIAAIVLLGFGTGSIKGFATAFMIGILTSMFTAIVGTRAIVNLAFGGRKIKDIPV